MKQARDAPAGGARAATARTGATRRKEAKQGETETKRSEMEAKRGEAGDCVLAPRKALIAKGGEIDD